MRQESSSRDFNSIMCPNPVSAEVQPAKKSVSDIPSNPFFRSVCVHQPQDVLRRRIPLLRSLPKPLHRFCIVFCDAARAPIQIHHIRRRACPNRCHMFYCACRRAASFRCTDIRHTESTRCTQRRISTCLLYLADAKRAGYRSGGSCPSRPLLRHDRPHPTGREHIS